MLFEEFQDGRHLGYQNRMILAILTLSHCDAFHQISAQSDLWFGRRCCLKNGYQNGKILAILNLSHCDAFKQVSAESDLQFGRCRLKNFMVAILDIEWNDFSSSDSLCQCDASHQVLTQSNLWFGRCRLKNFKMAAILDIGTEGF